MARIIGHIDYGTPAKAKIAAEESNKPASIGSVARDRRASDKRNPSKTPRADTRRKAITQDELYDWLLDIAKAGDRCPDNDQMLKKSGVWRRVFNELIAAGRIEVQIGTLNYRVVYFIGTEWATKGFPQGHHAHLRVTSTGHYRKNIIGHWVPK